MKKLDETSSNDKNLIFETQDLMEMWNDEMIFCETSKTLDATVRRKQ